MTDKRSARTRIPNGEEIKKLRVAKGLSQPKFASLAGVSQRTLQRAEQGEPVGSNHLTIIAKRLEVPREQIVMETADSPQAETKDVFRLDPVSGRQLVELLVTSFLHTEYSFRVDPSSETSELIADLMEFCDECFFDLLKPTHQIRAIGQLNDKLEVLASRDVGMFASELYSWEAAEEKSDANKSIWKPQIKGRLLIAFGPVNAPFVSDVYHSRETLKHVYEVCAKRNLQLGIDPDALEKGAFHTFYRAYCDAQRGTMPNETKVIALVPRE